MNTAIPFIGSWQAPSPAAAHVLPSGSVATSAVTGTCGTVARRGTIPVSAALTINGG
ncbi:MAG TPA: hypothetical protein VFY45_24490 [Baekduia sp.]|nr:hypothetical protein [Baekduia sp.]